MTSFRTWAAMGKDQDLVPWSYEPRPLGPMDVEIKISHCGVCGSDIHTIDSGWSRWMGTHYPCTVGHEIAGTVVALGSGVKTHKLGDRVGVGAHCWACFEPDCPACSKGMDHICPKHVNTYQGFYPDGTMTQGGYADKVRVDESHVIPIPDKVPLEHAAPLLCGGVTVYGPLKRFGAGPGKTVGIAGIGGIGHFGIMFAKAMGAHTVAISSSDSKEEDAMKLGADDYVSTAGDDFKKWFGKIDLIVITANAYDEATLGKYFMMLGLRGVAALVGAPEQPMQIGPGFLIFGEKQFVGSAIGPVSEIKEMLDLVAAKDIKPWIQEFPLSKCNDAIKVVRDGKIRFRAVLTVDDKRDFPESK